MKEEIIVQYNTTLKITVNILRNVDKEFYDHFHTYYVIGFLEQGQRVLKYKGTSYKLLPGNFFVANPNDTHRLLADSNKKMTFYSICMPVDVLQQYISRRELSNHFAGIFKFKYPIISNKQIISLFFEVHDSIIKQNKNLNYIQNILKKLIYELIQLNPDQKQTKIYIEPKISFACNYFKNNYAQKIIIDELCVVLEIKPTNFYIKFKKYIGISPMRYIINERIIAAKKLLKENRNISETALNVGFCDYAHFTKLFKKIVGITPSEYKKIYWQKQ